ncbi:pyridoxal kinase [Nannochloropsis oceanica]
MLTTTRNDNPASPPTQARVLSIQSHVVHGYVGNKSAVFPLQLLGLDVDPVNSVQFSNHTGYSTCNGDVLNGAQLLALIDGLERNNLLSCYTHLLTGYIGSASFLQAVVQIALKLKQKNPDLIYVCDPVLGDEGKIYVPEDLVEMYKTLVLPVADVLTPNQFEAEMLTGIKIQNESDAQRACLLLHAHGPRTVVVTSASLEGGYDALHVVGSQRHGISWRSPDMCRLLVPRIPGDYTGTGDLTAALLLAWLHLTPGDAPSRLEGVLENVIATVQATLKRTRAEAGESAELRLIQSKEDIERPRVEVRAERLVQPVDIRGVIFDMDGTLTRPGQIDFKRIHARLNIPDAEDILSFIEGMRSAAEREAALTVVEEEEMRGFIDVQLQEGAEEVVAWLREERGMQVALATRNNAKCVEKLVELCNFHPSTISSSMHDLSLNPALTPSPFSSSSSLASSGSFHPILTRVFKSAVDVDKLLAVSELWGLAPSSILVVGDSLEDCQWAHMAGMKSCLIHIGASHTLDTLRSGYVHTVIESLGELQAMLGGPQKPEGEE